MREVEFLFPRPRKSRARIPFGIKLTTGPRRPQAPTHDQGLSSTLIVMPIHMPRPLGSFTINDTFQERCDWISFLRGTAELVLTEAFDWCSRELDVSWGTSIRLPVS